MLNKIEDAAKKLRRNTEAVKQEYNKTTNTLMESRPGENTVVTFKSSGTATNKAQQEWREANKFLYQKKTQCAVSINETQE